MAIDFSKLKKIIEGKTKVIYAHPENPKLVYMAFKDDITAGDGVKHDVLEGKAVLDWKTNRDIYEYLNRKGIPTHYVESPETKVSVVKKLDFKINLEVVTRRVATGSILKWSDYEEGARFDPLITQFHYKDDPLHDPMLDDDFIEHLIKSKGATEYDRMRGINKEVFIHLEHAFAQFKVQLIDFKLEYGLIDGQVCMIDEVSGGSFRLWPYAVENPDLSKANVLDQLNPAGRLDKDIYRKGEGLEKVKNKFAEIAGITARFKEL